MSYYFTPVEQQMTVRDQRSGNKFTFTIKHGQKPYTVEVTKNGKYYGATDKFAGPFSFKNMGMILDEIYRLKCIEQQVTGKVS